MAAILSPADMIFLRRMFLALPDGATTPEAIAVAMRATCDRDIEIINGTIQNLERGDGSYQRAVSGMAREIHRRVNAAA